MAKISWLDSVRMPSNIHITADGVQTLCGYNFSENFATQNWLPFRVSKHAKGRCQQCVKLAKKLAVDSKEWHEFVPETDTTKLPIWSAIKNRIRKT